MLKDPPRCFAGVLVGLQADKRRGGGRGVCFVAGANMHRDTETQRHAHTHTHTRTHAHTHTHTGMHTHTHILSFSRLQTHVVNVCVRDLA